MFFVSSSDALFSFYICSHSKAEKVKFSECKTASVSLTDDMISILCLIAAKRYGLL